MRLIELVRSKKSECPGSRQGANGGMQMKATTRATKVALRETLSEVRQGVTGGTRQFERFCISIINYFYLSRQVVV